jgi:hypothetical protein
MPRMYKCSKLNALSHNSKCCDACCCCLVQTSRMNTAAASTSSTGAPPPFPVAYRRTVTEALLTSVSDPLPKCIETFANDAIAEMTGNDLTLKSAIELLDITGMSNPADTASLQADTLRDYLRGNGVLVLPSHIARACHVALPLQRESLYSPRSLHLICSKI